MEENKQLEINLASEKAQGVYANLALITHSNVDFVLDFASILPGMPKAEVVSRVIMAPENAKRLLGALQENIMKYEQMFGRIELPGAPQGGTATPFGVGKNTQGDA